MLDVINVRYPITLFIFSNITPSVILEGEGEILHLVYLHFQVNVIKNVGHRDNERMA